MATHVISLTGWVHVHTWRESHGNHNTEIFQREQDPRLARRVELLEVSKYRDGQPDHVRMDYDKSKDYLLAKEIRANPAKYEKLGERSISPCYTAGSDNFRDTETEKLYRIFGAAGHGEWAFEIEERDLLPEGGA